MDDKIFNLPLDERIRIIKENIKLQQHLVKVSLHYDQDKDNNELHRLIRAEMNRGVQCLDKAHS